MALVEVYLAIACEEVQDNERDPRRLEVQLPAGTFPWLAPCKEEA